jgi:pyridoxamine 5'-phosphate oxidase
MIMPGAVADPLAAEPVNNWRNVDHPLARFQVWLQEAIAAEIKEPTAMSVATVDQQGWPDTRMILLKAVDERGFVFYTNMRSPKAEALLRNPRVALCFYWDKIDKQVRVRGCAHVVTDEEANGYFATRPRVSQISAWASKQSRPISNYFELEARIAKTAVLFGLGDIPRPPFWSGFLVVPESIEFWIQKPFRRHHRIRYERQGDDWRKQWLYP